MLKFLVTEEFFYWYTFYMKLEIPFYSSFAVPGHPLGVHCVETSLRMILGYFEPSESYNIEDLEKISGKQPGKGSWSFRWSLWFVEHGYEVKHYTIFDFNAFIKSGVDYIRQEYGDDVANFQEQTSDVEGARKLAKDYVAKINIVHKKPTIDDIRSEMSRGFVVKPMVNSMVLNDKEGYEGHSVVVLDIDDSHIRFHDPGLPAFKDRRMRHARFQEAMDSFGGEMDAIRQHK